MPLDMPPVAPVQAAYMAPAPECRYLTQDEAQVALSRLRSSLLSTNFDNARPSEICGLVRVQLASGKVVYTDPTGRYLLLTFALDTHKGAPADTSAELERTIDARSAYPEESIPGVMPPEADPEAPRMTPLPPTK